MNKVLEDMIRHYITPKMDTWDTMLPVLEFAINNSYQESIQDTPFYMNYGRHPRMPDDLRNKKPSKDARAFDFIRNIERAMTKAKQCLKDAQHRQKRYYDATHRDLQFNVGDKVWLNSRNIPIQGIGARKFFPLWLGPFPITAKVGAVAYQLDIPPHYKLHNTFHVSLLKGAYDNHARQSPPVMIDGEEEYELELVLQHRPKNKWQGDRNIWYQVKWHGYDPVWNTWEPEWNLEKHALEALQDYWDRATALILESCSGTGLAPGLPTLPPATKSKGTPRPLVRPVGRRNCTRMITKANS